ncbi:hypothetical protein ACHAWF_004199 [Thalassiosira exigua]
MKFVALLSGGKDSIYAALRAVENGHELACCAHLAPRLRPGYDGEGDDEGDDEGEDVEEESYMYQTAGSEAVRLQVEGCMGLPYYEGRIRGRSANTSLAYDAADGGSSSDEVEDLYALLKRIKSERPDVTAVSSGAILSTYQRTRIENVCSRLGLTSLSYLWRASSQRRLLDSILDDGGIDAVLVRVACPPGLSPRRHLGKSLRTLRDDGTLDRLMERWGMHPAGEGGEYETLVLDCPRLFKRGRLVLDETEVVCDDSDEEVGVLRIKRCSVVEIDSAMEDPGAGAVMESGTEAQRNDITRRVEKAKSAHSAGSDATTSEIPSGGHQFMHLPNVRVMKGGLCHVSALLSPTACHDAVDEASAAIHEFLSIRKMLEQILARLFPGDVPPASPKDVAYVHLYLSEMSHFAGINAHYKECFGTHLPPSRSCVAVGEGALPGGRRVMMDLILQRGSGGYLRSADGAMSDEGAGRCDTFLEKALRNKHHALRRTLHVQSISTWAPVCIGPYSQANVLRSLLVFLAGMIGLVPETMALIEPSSSRAKGWEVQLCQSWKNAAAVLDGLEDGGGTLEDCLGGLVYLSASALGSVVRESAASTSRPNADQDADGLPWPELWKVAEYISRDALATNGGIVPGSVDGVASAGADPSMDAPADPDLYDEDGVLYGGYEDEETWRELSGMNATKTLPTSAPDPSRPPLLMVCLPELPAGAEAEVELVLASRRAASCLDVSNGSLARSVVPQRKRDGSAPSNGGIIWDTGYDHRKTLVGENGGTDESSQIEISSASRCLGLGCACVSTVVAAWKPGNGAPTDSADAFDFDVEYVLRRMLRSSIDGAKGEGESSSLFALGDVLNVRLYYEGASLSRSRSDHGPQSDAPSIKIETRDDGSALRTQLHSVLRLESELYNHKNGIGGEGGLVDIPAYTVVPVLGMHLSHEQETPTKERGRPLMAMQVTMVDMIRLETEVWARHNRQYDYDN